VVPRSCALAARLAGEEPVGWSIIGQRFVLLEVPLPWPHLIEHASNLPPGLGEVIGRLPPGNAVRFEAIAPDEQWSVPGRTRIILLDRSDAPASGYRRSEHLVREADVADLVATWLAGGVVGGIAQDVRDILVCTHGSHDTCCGRFGAPIHQALRQRYAGPKLRVWRGSHTGGHRFAPTLVDFPDGRSWGRLTIDELSAIVERDRPPAELRGRYRGCGFLPSFYERLVEAELLFAHGWSWLDRHLTGRVIEGHRFDYPEEPDELDDRAVVRLTASRPGAGPSESWEAVIERGADRVTRGECGEEPWESPSFRVTDLRRVDPGDR